MTAAALRRFVRLPELALLVAVVLAGLQVSGTGGWLAAQLDPWLPIDPSSIDPLDAATAAFALGALAVGLRRRKRLAWPLAVGTFGAAIAAQVVVLRHPLAAAIAVACLVALIVGRARYRTSTDRVMRRFALAVVGAAAMVLVLGSIAAGVVAAAPPGSLADTLTMQLVETLDFVDPTGLVSADRPEDVLEAIEFVARSAVLVALLAILAADPDRPRPAQLADRRDAVRRLARGPLAPFQGAADKLVFADPSGRGFVAYGRAGRTAVVLGDPIGPPDAAWPAFRAFLARCSSGDVRLAVYQASDASRATLRRHGFRVFRVGEEAVVDLSSFDLSGARRANLRHTVTRAGRGGATASWHADGLPDEEVARLRRELLELDRRWRQSHGPALGFTIGALEPTDLGSVGVALSTREDGRVEAFATFRRVSPGGWVLDVMRRRQDAVPGALEQAIATAALAMGAAGDRELSLGLVALAGLSVARGPREERLLASARTLASRWYDIDGLLFFKGKFNPAWVPRYGAVQGRFGLIGFALALLRLHLEAGAASVTGGRTRRRFGWPRLRRPPAGAAG